MFIQTKSPKITGLASFTILYTLGFTAFSLSLENYSALPHLGLQLALMLFLYIAHRRIHYAPPLLWTFSFFGLLNLAGGLIPFHSTDAGMPIYLNDLWVLHERLTYRTLVHVYGFAIVTWVNWQTLCNIIHNRYQRRLMPSTGLLMLVVSSAIGYGAIGEMVAHLADHCLNPERMINITIVCDNMIGNLCGALLASVIIKIRNL